MFVTVSDEKLNEVKSLIPRLQEISGVEIHYDDKNKFFEIDPKTQNSYEALKVVSVIKALGLGFSIDDALRLMSDEYQLDVIDLKISLGSNPDLIRRVKGRIIGEAGKAKRIIQEYTSVIISIYDHYVAMIGTYDQLSIARKAIDMLIEGREHNTVYKYLDKAEEELVRYFSKNRLNNIK